MTSPALQPPGPDWKPNPGRCPAEAKGKRVRVQLANGVIAKDEGGATVPPGWAADEKGGCRWSKKGSPFDIAFYKVLGG